jgi:hypothetical protein
MKPKKSNVWDNIEKHMQNPEYVKAVYDFIRLTTS